ncbi:hypothetical protein MG293_000504 [Ovis ammon polii]|uniref:Uncharacterized protein n=1 Tax=Ovis ammon polii TaxID=230172 RepID=A0AAD4UNS0_OVIAM|nr:hypothetical protein MG293_000504 [Ovis ammon polii]
MNPSRSNNSKEKTASCDFSPFTETTLTDSLSLDGQLPQLGPNPKTTSKKGVEMGRKNGEKRKEEENKTKKVRPQRQERLPHLVRKPRNWKAEGKIIPGWLLVIRPKCHFIEEMVPETLSYHTVSIISMTAFMLINQQLACYQKGDRHLRPVDTEPGIGGIRELRFFQVLVTLKNV